MDNSYQDPNSAIKYLDFLNSPNGEIQKSHLLKAIASSLTQNKNLIILDAGCGPGWLAGALQKNYPLIQACDASEFFIQFAKGSYPKIDFKAASLEQPLPYLNHSFDAVILNMAGPDLNNLPVVFKNLSALIKAGGKLILTIPNPKYAYPAAEWKRGLIGFLLGQKPKLKIKNPPPEGREIQREFGKNIKISSYYHSLNAYILGAASARFKFCLTREIRSQTDSGSFDLNYQLYRYPLLLLLEFVPA